MDNKYFINETISKAINDYIECKKNPKGIKFNSFFVVVIRLLVIIFDELDITNPYDFCNESMLYSNLTKYGTSREEVETLFMNIDNYSDKENSETFIKIQKALVDMLMKKRKIMNVSDEECLEFRNLLYSPETSNPLRLSYNFLVTKNSHEVIDYFDKCLPENEKRVIEKPKKKLNVSAYEALKYSLEEIDAMNADELDEVNKKVYSYFDINENAVNSDYLLDKAVYDLNNPKFATNGGFVNILMFLAIICTLVMVLAIITFAVL